LIGIFILIIYSQVIILTKQELFPKAVRWLHRAKYPDTVYRISSKSISGYSDKYTRRQHMWVKSCFWENSHFV